MMRLGNANFATDGPCVTIKRSDTKHIIGGDNTMGSVAPDDGITPNELWWHSLMENGIYSSLNYPWPVCWRKDGVMALWFGKDGWGVWPGDTCRTHGKDEWTLVFDEEAHDGFPFASTDDGCQGYSDWDHSCDIPYSQCLAQNEETYLRVNGQYILVWETRSRDQEDQLWDDWEGVDWGSRNRQERKDSEEWCGHNLKSLEPFVILGDSKPPDPASESQVYYRISTRCTRLLLVQNAMFTDGDTISFSKARVRCLGHSQKSTRLAGINRTNGERPLFYERGAGRGRGITADTEFHFPPLDNAADPQTDIETYNNEYRSPVYAPETGRNGIFHPQPSRNMVYNEQVGVWVPGLGQDFDWPEYWPAFSLKQIYYDNSDKRHFGKITPRYWACSPRSVLEDVDYAKQALERDAKLVSSLFWKTVFWSEEPVRPFGHGTAFDMVLAVRTLHWRRYKAVLTPYKHSDKNGTKWDNYKGNWEFDTSGYFNSQVAGWIYQLAPTKGA